MNDLSLTARILAANVSDLSAEVHKLYAAPVVPETWDGRQREVRAQIELALRYLGEAGTRLRSLADMTVERAS